MTCYNHFQFLALKRFLELFDIKFKNKMRYDICYFDTEFFNIALEVNKIGINKIGSNIMFKEIIIKPSYIEVLRYFKYLKVKRKRYYFKINSI